MDPTEIVLVPYDLQRLGIYVLGATFVSIISSENDLIWIKTLLMLQWTAFAFIAMIICGASWREHVWHSLVAALHLVTMAFWDPPIFAAASTAGGATTSALAQYRYNNQLYLERFSLEPTTSPSSRLPRQCHQQEWLQKVIVHCVLAVTIPLQILRLGDWGLQIQRWPAPTILGASIGWSLALLLGTPAVLFMTRHDAHSKKTSNSHDD